MGSQCQTYAQAYNAGFFPGSCAIEQSAITPAVTTALKTCCSGGPGIFNTPDGCFTYCNITSNVDALFWQTCLLDNLDSSDAAILFLDNDADSTGCEAPIPKNAFDATASVQGYISTTWTGEGQTLTVSSSGSAITTVVLPTGNPLTAGSNSSAIATAKASGKSSSTSATGKSSSSTSAAPASTSSKASSASTGMSFSKAGATVLVGLALFTALL